MITNPPPLPCPSRVPLGHLCATPSALEALNARALSPIRGLGRNGTENLGKG
jgi:hypothetical protein